MWAFLHTHGCCVFLPLKPPSLSTRTSPPLQVVKKAKLTKLVFNPKHPIVLVGDDRGTVTSLKLSPNLRKTSVPQQKGQKVEDLEVAKLEAVMEVARKSDVHEASAI